MLKRKETYRNMGRNV